MIWVDTGPLIALFDPRDTKHRRCRQILSSLDEPLYTTVPVLTEAFHMLSPGSVGSQRLMEFITTGGLCIWHLDESSTNRALDLMRKYADQGMDMADASLVVGAETTGDRKIFTLDRKDFIVYRVSSGHQSVPLDIVT
jgi:predicted nucleic acid-binding protein